MLTRAAHRQLDMRVNCPRQRGTLRRLPTFKRCSSIILRLSTVVLKAFKGLLVHLQLDARQIGQLRLNRVVCDPLADTLPHGHLRVE